MAAVRWGLLSTAAVGHTGVEATRASASTSFLGVFDVGMSHSRRDELELVGSTGSLVVPDRWIGVSRSIERRRDMRRETIPVPVAADSRLGEDPGAVAQAAVLEAVDRSGRARMPVELDR